MTKDTLDDGGRPHAPWRSHSSWRDEDTKSAPGRGWRDVVLAAVPHVATQTIRVFLGVTVALYILNQKHALPKPLSAVVSKALFWPTLPITASRRIGKWMTRIDDTVVMGGAPFGFLDFPERLYNEFGVSLVEIWRVYECLSLATPTPLA